MQANPEASFTAPTENPFSDALPDQATGQRRPPFPADLNRYATKLTKLVHVPNGMNFSGYIAELEVISADKEQGAAPGDVHAVFFGKSQYPDITSKRMAQLRALVAAQAGKRPAEMDNQSIFDLLGRLVVASGEDLLSGAENDVTCLTCVSPSTSKKTGQTFSNCTFYPAA